MSEFRKASKFRDFLIFMNLCIYTCMWRSIRGLSWNFYRYLYPIHRQIINSPMASLMSQLSYLIIARLVNTFIWIAWPQLDFELPEGQRGRREDGVRRESFTMLLSAPLIRSRLIWHGWNNYCALKILISLIIQIIYTKHVICSAD